MSFLTPNVQNILVQYLDDTYPIVLAQDRPFMDRITKKGNVGGTSAKVPFNVGYGGGAGGDFETSLANAQASGAVRGSWSVDPAKLFGVTYVENSEVPFTQTPESAIDILTDATKGASYIAAQNYSNMIFSSGFGDLATIASSSNPSGNLFLITLTVTTDVNKFNLNNSVVSKATPAAASLDSGAATVIGLNPQYGIIEVDAGSSGWTPTNTHVLGLAGQMLASTSISTFPGIFGFVPPVTARDASGVVGDTFLGVTRNSQTSVVATSGWAIDGRNKPLFPTVNGLASQMASFKNCKPDTLVANPVLGARMAAEIDTKVRYEMPSRDVADVFYMGFEVATGAGKLEVLFDATCPANQVVMTKADTWVYAYPDKPFAPTSLTGNIAVESYDHNRTRFAVTASGFFYTTNPACTGVITVTP